MASISREPNGRKTIQFVDGTKRRSIRLGKVSERVATLVRLRVESLVAARASGHPLDQDTAVWLGKIDGGLHDRLARCGLVPTRAKANEGAATLSQHLDGYFGSLGKQKPTTARNYARARRLLEKFFGKDRRLESITEGDADAYKRWLLARYAPASASVDLRRARQFLRAAVRQRLIASNPFADVPCGSQANDRRIVYVSPEDIERVIDICPDEDWRLIFALPRFAGVRFPSEVEGLKWSDVNWEQSRLTLREPKVEHHPGRGLRVVPIFEALRPHLERAYQRRAPDAVYVVPLVRRDRNLRTQAKRHIKKAGLKPWPKLFVNLRGSCSDDLERRGVAEKAINAWIGNTARLRSRHYRSVRPEDWAVALGKAVQNPVHSPAVSRNHGLSTEPEVGEKPVAFVGDFKSDTPGRDRTCDLRFRKPSLYPLSYGGGKSAAQTAGF